MTNSDAHARQEHAKNAALERLWSHTVGIANRALVTEGTDPGSGMRAREEEAPGTCVAAFWGTHYFLITAKHVLEQAELADLSYFARPTGAFDRKSQVTINDLLAPVPLSDPDSTIQRCEWEDLALITVQKHALGPYLEFADISTAWVDPAEGETVIGVGFPVSSGFVFVGKQVGPVIQKAVLLAPVGFSGEVQPASIGKYFGQFDPKQHYLIPYDLASQGKNPKGISGAAVWFQDVEQKAVWTPRFKFAGICTSSYKDGSIEQIVKASVVRHFVTEVFGQPE